MKKSKRRGKSHSTRPVASGPPPWLKYTPEQIEELVVLLSRRGCQPSMIGTILRDQYGIPLVKQAVGKRIAQILRERGVLPSMPEDLLNLMRRAARIMRHMEEHPRDQHSERGLRQVESKIHRLAKYYRREGVLPPDWEYRPEKVSIFE